MLSKAAILSLAQTVPFVHPGIAAAALLAALVPLIIHLISRRRYRRMPWAAMSFLLAATKRTARRLRFEQLLLLLVRTAIVLMFGLALARPFLSAPSVARATGGSGHRVLLIDNSLSMSAMRADGKTRFAAAQEYALALLDQFAAGDTVTIVSFAAPAERLLTYPTHDRRLARERLMSLQVTDRATDFTSGVAKAAELIGEWRGPWGAQSVHLISDFSLRRENVAGDSSATGKAADALAEMLRRELADVREVVLVSADNEHRPNAGVASLSLDQPVVVRGAAEALNVTVANHGPNELAGAELQLLRRGEVIRREPIPPLASGRMHQTRVSIGFPTPGVHLLEARLIREEGDALKVDDTRHLSVEVVYSVRALLVDGRSGSKPPDGEAGYLAVALSPASTIELAEGGLVVEDVIESKVIAARDLSAAALEEFDVVVLCNVAELAAEDWARLRSYAAGGGGLMFSLGEQVSMENYNALGFANEAGLLPGRLEAAVEAASNEGAEPLRFSPESPRGGMRHPILYELVNNPSSGLFSARIDRYLRVAPAQDAEILLNYTDGAAALLGRTIDRGRVLLYTTTANMGWNTLPAKGDYVSLMRGAVAYVARARGAGRNLLVGQPICERLTASEVQLPHQAAGPDGSVLSAAIERDGDALTLALAAPSRAGAYELTIGDNARSFAVNVDAAECDLSFISAPALCAEIGKTCRAASVDAQPQLAQAPPAVELGAVMLLLVCGLLFTEMWLAGRFGLTRGADAK